MATGGAGRSNLIPRNPRLPFSNLEWEQFVDDWAWAFAGRTILGKPHLTALPHRAILNPDSWVLGEGTDVETRSTDAKGRISLPKSFANATVVMELVSETEVRIRKAVVIPEDQVRFYEETAAPLSDRDRDRFLDLLDNPPPANAALRRAVAKRLKSHG